MYSAGTRPTTGAFWGGKTVKIVVGLEKRDQNIDACDFRAEVPGWRNEHPHLLGDGELAKSLAKPLW